MRTTTGYSQFKENIRVAMRRIATDMQKFLDLSPSDPQLHSETVRITQDWDRTENAFLRGFSDDGEPTEYQLTVEERNSPSLLLRQFSRITNNENIKKYLFVQGAQENLSSVALVSAKAIAHDKDINLTDAKRTLEIFKTTKNGEHKIYLFSKVGVYRAFNESDPPDNAADFIKNIRNDDGSPIMEVVSMFEIREEEGKIVSELLPKQTQLYIYNKKLRCFDSELFARDEDRSAHYIFPELTGKKEQLAWQVLKEIQTKIYETDSWGLGAFLGGIHIDWKYAEAKQMPRVPKHVEQILLKIKGARDNPDTSVAALSDIKNIVQTALQSKNRLGLRSAVTQTFYENLLGDLERYAVIHSAIATPVGDVEGVAAINQHVPAPAQPKRPSQPLGFFSRFFSQFTSAGVGEPVRDVLNTRYPGRLP